MRYSELKYEGQTYEEQWKIDEILIKNKFNWIVNAEIENARLEIYQDTLVWNGGTWYNGSWYFGVWRDGAWKYGTWENGVWYGGRWENGTFKSGIIFKGNFFGGKIDGGEIRGGNFVNVQISPSVVEYTGDEYQANQQDKQAQAQKVTAQAQPQDPNKVRANSTPPAAQVQAQEPQPKIQQEKIEYKMKKLKTFENFEDDPYAKYEYDTTTPADNVDELSKTVIEYLTDWQNGKYNRESTYLMELAGNLQKIKVLFSRDIKKISKNI